MDPRHTPLLRALGAETVRCGVCQAPKYRAANERQDAVFALGDAVAGEMAGRARKSRVLKYVRQ